MDNYTLLVSMVFLLSTVQAYKNGPPLTACVSMFPTGHNYDAKPESEDPGFKIMVNETSYSAGSEITVTISGSGHFYEGVFIQARRAICDDGKNDEPQGTFMLADGETLLKTFDCGTGQKNAVSHLSSAKKYNNTLTWKAPSSAVGTIYFRGTFVVERDEFWTTVSSDFVSDPADSSTPKKCTVQTTRQTNNDGLRLSISSLGLLLWAALPHLF